MIEFNINWNDDSLAELEKIVKLVKDELTDVQVNITRDSQKSSPKKVMVPEMRLKQIVAVLENSAKNGKPALSKEELITLLTQSEAGALSKLTASVYVSNASGCGVLDRTHNGYVVTPHGKESYGSKE